MVQSRDIARFLAERHGLMGVDEWQAARIDALIGNQFDCKRLK